MPYPIFMSTSEVIRTPAVEDYTKAIYSLESRHDEPVSTKTLAERLEITPGSVSAMLRRLEELGLITHEPYRGVRLTKAGRRIALEVIRHHRLLESYLAEVLGMPWDRVHAEAEVLEHVLSDDLEELIAAKLGNPPSTPTATRSRRPPSTSRRARPTAWTSCRSARAGASCAYRTPIRRCSATSPRRESRSATSSRSSRASPSGAPCSCASASAPTPSAMPSRGQCAWRWESSDDDAARSDSGSRGHRRHRGCAPRRRTERAGAAARERQAARDAGDARSCLRRLCRIRRPGQLRRRHPGRRQVRVHSACGLAGLAAY